MKYPTLYSLLLSTTLLSCNTDIIPPIALEDHIKEAEQFSKYHISKDKATEIADIVINTTNHSRHKNTDDIEFDYVIKKQSNSRSETFLPDTLAYIINYPDNHGFVIVSSDNRVSPVLAFSNTENFSYDNEIAKEYFINNIEAHLLNGIHNNDTFTVDDTFLEGCLDYQPMITTALGQRSPYDKYVIEEHPGCPAGCVAVATTMIMTHTFHNLTYHNSFFNFTSIRNAFVKKSNETDDNPMNLRRRISGGYYPREIKEEYSYEQSVDSLARILYWIGKDLNMSYNTSVSLANSRKAYKLLTDLKFDMASGYNTYSIGKVCLYLNDNCIIYLIGQDSKGAGGHAWVCDGGYFCITDDGETTYNEYIHCDWGWGGRCNGYYKGSVFNASSYNFQVTNYFAVKKHI